MGTSKTNFTKGLFLVGIGIVIGVAMPGARPSNAKEARKVEPPRIGYVNVAKVLRDYNRANHEGARITKLREEYVGKVQAERDNLASINEQYGKTDDVQLKKALQQQALTIQRRIEDIDKEAQEKLTQMSNDTIVAVYAEIRNVIAVLAKDHGLDVVEAFPAASKPEDEKSPQVAQLMLQTPALIPYYIKPELDFTEEVIERLNKKYPPEKEEKAGK